MMRIVLLSMALVISFIAGAQDKNNVSTTIFKASITCENCEAKIMKHLPYEKGVKDVHVDVDNKLITVSYKSSKNSDEKLNNAIEKLGYNSKVLGQPIVFKVYGNCDMCKERIEKALTAFDSVTSAMWNATSKEVIVMVGSKEVNLQELQNSVAKLGHDTDRVKASDEAYALLPQCCKYTRAK